MTAFFVSFQGFTHKMTRVSLSNCLTSGVHLTARSTGRSKWGLAFVFNESDIGGWGRACKARLSPESPKSRVIARDRKSKQIDGFGLF